LRKRKALLVSGVILAALSCAFFFLKQEQEKTASPPPADTDTFLTSYESADILEIAVQNEWGAFTLRRENGTLTLSNLPMEETILEYIDMLLDEAANITYSDVVTPSNDDAPLYGLDPPGAHVTIRYRDAGSLTLLFGAEEPVSRGRYFTLQDTHDNAVYLMPAHRAARFLMPLTSFINYEITPFFSFASPLTAIKRLRLSGEAFSAPVEIEEVESGDPDGTRRASSFGAATHVITSPGYHEIDQGECVRVFGSLMGLLNIDVLDYNCDDAKLASYGFDAPYLKAEYDFKRDENAPLEKITLKAARYRGGFIALREGSRTVHRIESEPFLHTSYEKLAMRWFLTPFITDLQSLDIRLGGGQYTFVFSGGSNRNLAVEVNGRALDIDAFRKFYILLISASNDGALLKNPVNPPSPLVTLAFHYRDPLKPPDTLRLFDGGPRRLNVEVNGLTEFAMLRRYLPVVTGALEALLAGRDFSVEW
jgi:hypothetical protein